MPLVRETVCVAEAERQRRRGRQGGRQGGREKQQGGRERERGREIGVKVRERDAHCKRCGATAASRRRSKDNDKITAQRVVCE